MFFFKFFFRVYL